MARQLYTDDIKKYAIDTNNCLPKSAKMYIDENGKLIQ